MEIVDGWEIKKKIRKSGVYCYEIAEHLNIAESTLSRRLRNPSKEEAAEILKALKELKCKAG